MLKGGIDLWGTSISADFGLLTAIGMSANKMTSLMAVANVHMFICGDNISPPSCTSGEDPLGFIR